MCIGCKAQTIIPLFDGPTNVNGGYYKDTYNDLNKFEGTWKYTNGTTSLTIILQKREMISYDDSYNNYYEDVLIGGYIYVENGIEKVNTLPQLTFTLPNSYNYHISGNIIIGPGSIYCMDCGVDERMVLLQFSDPNRDILGMEPEMLLRRSDSGTIQKIKLIFRSTSGAIARDGQIPLYTSYTVPFGEYLLVKQP